MYRENNFKFIEIALIGIFSFFSCWSDLGRKSPAHEQAKTEIAPPANMEGNTKPNNAMMDYEPVPFPQLIGTAAFIVMGNVKTVTDSTFEFNVDESLKQGQTPKTMTIAKYIPPEIFAPRKAWPYAVGQRFVFFLAKPTPGDNNKAWQVLGFAGEGEMPMDDSFVYLENISLEGLESSTNKVHGLDHNLQRLDSNDFKDAVTAYNKCFQWTMVETIKNNKPRQRLTPSKTCADADLKAYQSKSWIHDYLVRETINKIP